MPVLKDRIKGGLYGVAIGDALGCTLEFMTQDQIKAKYGVLMDIVGGGWLNLRPGEWTDDTEMTLAVAKGIMQDIHDPIQYIGDAFMAWRETNPPDIGNTIRAVFDFTDRYLPPITEKNWLLAAKKVAERMQTAGNGALMRTIPVGLAYGGNELIERARMIAAMTHYDPEAGISCALYCLAVRNYLYGEEKLKGWGSTFGTMKKSQGGIIKDFWKKYKKTMNEDPPPTGYTVDSLLCAVESFLKSSDFEEAVISAVNRGGDADTIGAITGGLAGVFYGYSSIPKRWTEKFTDQQRQRLDGVVEWFIEHNRRWVI